MLNIYLIFYTHQIFRGAFEDDLNNTQPNSRQSYYLREYQEVVVSLKLLQRPLLVFQRSARATQKRALFCVAFADKRISARKKETSPFGKNRRAIQQMQQHLFYIKNKKKNRHIQ